MYATPITVYQAKLGVGRENRFDTGHYVAGEQRYDIEGFHVFVDLGCPTSPRNHTTHVGVLETPGQRHLSEGTAKLTGKGNELLDDSQIALIGQALLEPFVALERPAAVAGDALAIFAGQHARCEWAENRGTEANVTVQQGVFFFETRAVQHVVLGLLHGGGRHAQFTGDAVGGADFIGRPF